jgi:hypothetical protein
MRCPGWRVWSVTCAVAVATGGAAAAQDSAVVVAGDAVRISAPSLGLYKSAAVFVRVDRDTLVVRAAPGDTTLTAIPLAAVSKFEVNHGNRAPARQTLKGALIGGSVGILAGTIASMECQGYYGSGECRSKFGPMMAGLGAGALVGAGVGSLIKVARFRTVKLAPDVTATMALSRCTVGLRVTFHLQP